MANLVTLSGYVLDASNNPVEAADIRIRIFPVPQYIPESLISKEDFVLQTDETGYFEIELIGGLGITVVVPEAKYQTTGRLPLSGSIDITQLDKHF